MELVQHGGTPDGLGQVALVASEQNGEGGEQNVLRRVPIDGLKSLGVGDDQLGTLAQSSQSGGQLTLLDHYIDAAGVQDVPNDLLLGQDEPSLGGGGVEWE